MLRFAPSPTGDMHIGNLRAAILNYIIAKQRGEKFLIRIEDTDSARNIEGADKEILAILNLFGLFWDKLVYQSENFPLHRKLAQNLIEKNKAFYCYATKDFLEQKRAEASAQKRAFRYKDEWAEVCKGENEKPVIRLKGIAESNANSACGDFLGSASARFLDGLNVLSSSLASHNPKNSSTILEFASCNRSAESTLDSADSQNLGENLNQKPIKSFCYFWLSPKVESPLPLNPNLPNNVDSARGAESSKNISALRDSANFAESITFFDAIKGKCKFSQNEIDSFVIMRDDIPTYNFACAVDDMLYDISFIIRGEDHTSNTPKQMLIHRALGYDKSIKYAHLPIILNNDGKKMSKRESESSVKWLLSQGFLPRAIVNYLLLMGNNPPCEIFSLDEAIAWFDLLQLSKSPVRFDINQLRHINREHLKRLSDGEMGLLLESSSELLSQIAGNSVLGMQFRTCGNFQASTDSSLVESPKISTNTKATPQSLPLRFCDSQNLGEIQKKITESSLDSADSQNLNQNNLSLRAESQNLHYKPPFCHSERSEESQKNNIVILSEAKNLKNNQNRDSSVASLPQNDNFKKIAESKIIKSLGAIGKIFLEEASTLNELNDKLNHIFAPKDLKNFEFGENARILKSEILRLLAESSAESSTKSSPQSNPLNDFNSLKDALSKNAPFKGRAFFMPLRFLLTGAQKGPHLDALYPHLRPFLAQILKD